MLVREVKEVARQWMETQVDRLPAFRGAILTGSINWQPDDAPWPQGSDVDVWGVLDVDETVDLEQYHRHFTHQGLAVDFVPFRAKRFQDWEKVEGTYWLACHVAAPSILLDPYDQLQALHAQVAEHYGQREWVRRRCADALAEHDRELAQLLVPAPVAARCSLLYWTVVAAAQIWLVADLANPTYRKAFVHARELLARQGRLDVHEALLEILGCQALDQDQVEGLYDNLVEAFACAARVAHTRFPLDNEVCAQARLVVIEGTREMIDSGYPREAVTWMMHLRPLCQTAIDLDGSEEEKRYFGQSYAQFLHTLGLDTLADYEQRAEQARRLRSTVMQVAEEIMAANRHITP